MLHMFVDVSMAFFRCCISLGAHIIEAVYAYILCRFIELPVCLSVSPSPSLPLSLSRRLNLTNSDTLKWIAQSFILGYISLRLLRERANNKSQK